MAHLHEIKDTDPLFVIDGETMDIATNAENLRLRQREHKSEVYTFSMPRYIEGHDMTLCNKREVHFINTNYDSKTRTTTQNKGFDEVENFKVSPDNDEVVLFTWSPSIDATELIGTLSICVRFACINDGVVEYQKFTNVCSEIQVVESILNSEEVARIYTDTLAKWKEEIDKKLAISGGGSARIGEITVKASDWVEEEEKVFSQVVEIDGVTEYSQVDLTPSMEQLAAFYYKDLSLVAVNEEGVVTVYAFGQRLQNDYTIQVTITEVAYED